MSVFLPPDFCSAFTGSPEQLVDYFQRTDLTVNQLAKLSATRITLPSTAYLAQLLRSQRIPAIKWEIRNGKVQVSFLRGSFLPYNWELKRRRRTAKLHALLNRWSATHDLYWIWVQCDKSKVPIEKAKEAARRCKLRLRQLNKSQALRALGIHLVVGKYELVIDIRTDKLLTYVHSHVIIAVPKGLNPDVVESTVKKAGKIAGLNFGIPLKWNDGKIGYLLKHPFKLRWNSGKGGYLPRLSVAARLNPQQALRIYRATQGMGDWIDTLTTGV